MSHEIHFGTQSRHKSIQGLPSEMSLPDFTVLTGYNGSGKTHFLQLVSINANAPSSFFDNSSFILENMKAVEQKEFEAHKELVKTLFGPAPIVSHPSINNDKEIFNAIQKILNLFNGSIAVLRALSGDGSKPLLSLKVDGSDSNSTAYQSFRSGVNQQLDILDNKTKSLRVAGPDRILLANAIDSAVSILQMIKNVPKADEQLFNGGFSGITVFEQHFTMGRVKGKLLLENISEIYFLYVNKFREFSKKNKMAEAFRVDKIVDPEKLSAFQSESGDPPWVVLNKILLEFNQSENFNIFFNTFEFSSLLDMQTEHHHVSCYPTDRNGTKLEFSDLSSGEKVLVALANATFQATRQVGSPSVLLLDEIDASLHPSQIKNLLNVLDNVFIKEFGMKVILATHSPTTVALAPDESIYLISTGDEKQTKVEACPKAQALALLSDGFMTLDEGVLIFSGLPKDKLIIFSEGNNIDYFEKLFEVKGINEVCVWRGLEAKSGKDQLKSLYNLLTSSKLGLRALFVFDCDVVFKGEESDSIRFHILSKNSENTLVNNGIENAFSGDLIIGSGFTETKTQDHSGAQDISFNYKCKPEFEKYVLKQEDPAIWNTDPFNKLIEKIQEMQSKMNKEPES